MEAQKIGKSRAQEAITIIEERNLGPMGSLGGRGELTKTTKLLVI